ncbi:hypothetical protein ABIF66_001816 [Bradyrhizobium japonicum]
MVALGSQNALAADYQIIDIQPGQTVDVYFEVNLKGTVSLRIATRTGLGCAELWWIKWPLGEIKSLGKKCGVARLEIPGFTDLAVAGKLRATGVSSPTKIVAAANERVANSITLHW